MKALLNVSVALMAVTGVAFAVMKYWMKSDDPFAVAHWVSSGLFVMGYLAHLIRPSAR